MLEATSPHSGECGYEESENYEIYDVGSAEEETFILKREAAAADATILIAPESGNELLNRARLVVESGGRLFSPGPDFIELTSSKHQTAEFLRARGVPAPLGILVQAGDPLPSDFPFPAVLKPVDGAGSQDVQLVEGPVGNTLRGVPSFVGDALRGVPSFVGDALRGVPGDSPDSPDGSGYTTDGGRSLQKRLEQYCPGMPASVAVLSGPAGHLILPACSQHLSSEGHFTYLGGRVPLSPGLNRRARRLAEACLAVLPPAAGYFGLDLVLGEDPGGAADVVIEVNPRLTTSYVGLRALANANLAGAWLAIAAGKMVELSFAAGPIEFRANGEIVA